MYILWKFFKFLEVFVCHASGNRQGGHGEGEGFFLGFF